MGCTGTERIAMERIAMERGVQLIGADDPRIRPWYVAASSGPKDVVIVLDVSGSMSQYNRLDLAKEAAETVINTL